MNKVRLLAACAALRWLPPPVATTTMMRPATPRLRRYAAPAAEATTPRRPLPTAAVRRRRRRPQVSRRDPACDALGGDASPRSSPTAKSSARSLHGQDAAGCPAVGEEITDEYKDFCRGRSSTLSRTSTWRPTRCNPPSTQLVDFGNESSTPTRGPRSCRPPRGRVHPARPKSCAPTLRHGDHEPTDRSRIPRPR